MKERHVLLGGEMSCIAPTQVVRISRALALSILWAVSGCSCSEGYPSDGGTDAGDGSVDTGTDTGVVDGGMDAAEAGPLCGNGVLDFDPGGEFGEVCDPNYPLNPNNPNLSCVCVDDLLPCTVGTWVPHPEDGVCFGMCVQTVQTGYGITHCDDGLVCTYDILMGDASMCQITCQHNPIANCVMCEPGQGGGEPCVVESEVGECRAGLTACDMNGVVQCMQNVTETPEICDLLDNDCDGQLDNGNPGSAATCNTGLPGVCAAGLTNCISGDIECTQQVQASVELCDGLDNNCDGMVDEMNPGGGVGCATGMDGICAMGTTVCSGGMIQCIRNMNPTNETCNGLDDNCQMGVDEGNPGGGVACTTGMPGVCGAGTRNCSGGMLVCNQNVPASGEVCDGFDNNCDGMTDNNVPMVGTACSTGQAGVCAAGTWQCQGGPGLVCVRNVNPSAEICDNLDNNCAGGVDEGNPQGGASCMTGMPGICNPGTTACVGGTLQCNRNSNPGTEICNGQDDNCDGTTDRGITMPVDFANACGSATSVPVQPGAGNAITRSGYIDSNGDDYFVVTFGGIAGNGGYYNPRIQMTNTQGGQYVMTVYDSCGGAAACQPTITDFSRTYPADQSGCISAANPDNCSDNLSRQTTWYVRVSRAGGAGATSCDQYSIRFSNQ